MKKFLKIAGILVIIIVVVAGVALSYVSFVLPNVKPPPDLNVEMTPERIQRGRYLANQRMGCVGCHAQRDYSRFAGPIVKATMGAGGEFWNREMNFPGEMYAPNITPYALKDWTDGEIFRAVTAGVDRDGNALFPIMPYHLFGRLPEEDIYDVIAYLRQLEPKEKTWPERKLDFPMSMIVNFIPKEGTHDLAPDPDNIVLHGKYLVTSAACYDCHTPMDEGQYIEEMSFAGGVAFPVPTGGTVYSSNITPDKNSGIGSWTKEAFIKRFKAYADSSFVPHTIAEGEFNTYMPWEYYAQLTEKDLEAMFAYLQSIEPVENQVVKFVE